MSSSSERAAKRRKEWFAEVVIPWKSKGVLYASLPLAARFKAFSRLNERVWHSMGATMHPPLRRSEWPGEIFEIERHD